MRSHLQKRTELLVKLLGLCPPTPIGRDGCTYNANVNGELWGPWVED